MIHLKLKNLHSSTEAARRLPPATYFGFALGADTHHTEVLVELQGQQHLVQMGSPVVLDRPIEGAPIVIPLRKVFHQVVDDFDATDDLNDYQSRVHVLGLTCCEELAIAFPQKPAMIQGKCDPTGAATLATMISVPFAGFSRALFSIDGDAGNVAIFGGMNGSLNLTGDTDPLSDTQSVNQEYQILATTAQAAGTVDYVVEDLDPYDVLQLRLGDGGDNVNVTVYYRVMG